MENNRSSNLTKIQLNTFDNGTEVREHHVMISLTDAGRTLTYADQLRLVTEEFKATRKELGARRCLSATSSATPPTRPTS